MPYTYMQIANQTLPYKLEHMEVFFSDLRCLDIIRAVLDEAGTIRNFPGIVEDERWTNKRRIGQCYDVRFEAQFYALENDEHLMLWMIQPNGWYWVDEDGFGFSGDSSITLYTVIDRNGGFLKEFELFSIDRTRFCHEFDPYLS